MPSPRAPPIPADGTGASGPASVRLLMRKCARARGFFSIYMTLAGVLTPLLVSALPRLALGGGAGVWGRPARPLGGFAPGGTSGPGGGGGLAPRGGGGGVLPRRRRGLVGAP